MALFEHGILGKVKGAVGDVVVKSNKGTDYSSKRIRHYKKTTSEPLIENRSIFSRRSTFFRFFDDAPLVGLVWEYSKLPGNKPYHKMFSYNYKFVKKDYVSTLFSILPAKHMGSFRNVKMDANSLSYEFSPDEDFCKSTVPPYYFIAFIYMYSPVDESLGNKEVTGILEQESKDIVVKHNEVNLYQFEVEPSQFEIMKDYKKVVIFPAIVSQNLKNKPVWAKSSGRIVKGDPDPAQPPEKPEEEKPKGPYKTFFMKVR